MKKWGGGPSAAGVHFNLGHRVSPVVLCPPRGSDLAELRAEQSRGRLQCGVCAGRKGCIRARSPCYGPQQPYISHSACPGPGDVVIWAVPGHPGPKVDASLATVQPLTAQGSNPMLQCLAV